MLITIKHGSGMQTTMKSCLLVRWNIPNNNREELAPDCHSKQSQVNLPRNYETSGSRGIKCELQAINQWTSFRCPDDHVEARHCDNGVAFKRKKGALIIAFRFGKSVLVSRQNFGENSTIRVRIGHQKVIPSKNGEEGAVVVEGTVVVEGAGTASIYAHDKALSSESSRSCVIRMTIPSSNGNATHHLTSR